MRQELSMYLDRRVNVRGVVSRFGVNRSRALVTVLLTDVVINNKIQIDHIWLRFKKIMDLRIGDVVEFRADVIKYKKMANIRGVLAKSSIDYGLDNIKNVRVVSAGTGKHFADYYSLVI